MNKETFKNLVKSGKVYTYGYDTIKNYNIIKKNNIPFKKDLQPLKMTTLSSIGSNFKDIKIEIYQGFIILSFLRTDNIAVYKEI